VSGASGLGGSGFADSAGSHRASAGALAGIDPRAAQTHPGQTHRKALKYIRGVESPQASRGRAGSWTTSAGREPVAASAVLDTHVALEGLVFGDVRVAPLFAAITAGRLRWLVAPPMRAELVRVVSGRSLSARVADADAAMRRFDALALTVEPPPAIAGRTPRCTDPDDQVFVDVALAYGARWLLTRDRALLALRRAAARRGLDILVPEAWAP
jgi:predicted nucleic acid-binding protein